MENIYRKALAAADYIKRRIIKSPDVAGDSPKIAVVLGSGLGPLADDIENPVEINYSEIPNFPLPTVEGHEGKLVYGKLRGKPVIVMKGRFHYYEGYDISQITFPVRVFKLMGINDLFVTNAAGGINKTFKPGDLMLIRDHISLFAPSPLRGRNIDEFGPRFPDMSAVYSKELADIAIRAAQETGVDIKEGVYAFAQGPMYETPAEIRALALLGADAVGMSTVPEVITARHCGMRVMGISCITNMAAGILDKPLDHREVMEVALQVEEKFTRLVGRIVEIWELEQSDNGSYEL